MLFSNKAKSIMQLVEKVKLCSLGWMKTNIVCFPLGYHMWWQQPLNCLDIG